MTPIERVRYRRARTSGLIVRVDSALCWLCIRRAIGRAAAHAHPHDHMCKMCPNAATSARLARARRELLVCTGRDGDDGVG